MVLGNKLEHRSCPRVAVIILNWNGWRDTIECLKSVEELTYPNYEVIVVDNGSVDNSVAQICNWVMSSLDRYGSAQSPPEVARDVLPPGTEVVLVTDKLTLIRSSENLGFAGGCNLAIDFALTRDPSIGFIFLLNNDARVEPECLTTCVVVAQREGAAIAGAVIKSEDGRGILSAGSKFPLELFKAANLQNYPNLKDWWPVDRVEGAAMLIRRDLLERRISTYGYYLDTGLFIYGEEVELCIWARRCGYKVIMVRDATVRHRVSAASGGSGSPLAYYYITRNRVHLARRFLSGWTKALFHLWYPPSRLIRAAHRTFERKPEISRAILEGLLDGYRKVHGKWVRHSEPNSQASEISPGQSEPMGRHPSNVPR